MSGSGVNELPSELEPDPEHDPDHVPVLLPDELLPGLALLEPLDTIFVECDIDPQDRFQGVRADKAYFVYSSDGKRIFYGAEISNRCCRCCLGQAHPFKMDLMDSTGTTIINLKRPMTFPLCMWGGDLCGDRLIVSHFNGDVLGTVVQKRGIRPQYLILDSSGKTILILLGPKKLGYCTLCRDVQFKIYLPENLNHEIGYITNNWTGILETKEDDDINPKYGICFPDDLESRVKAILIGAVLLIDVMFFEEMNTKFSGLICLMLIAVILFIIGIVCCIYFIPQG